jgi:hypothetical protein
MTGHSAAVDIRNAVVPVIRKHGRPAETLLAQGVPVLAMRAGGCVLSLWGPFKRSPTSPWPEPSTAALPGPLYHRLVVWHSGRVLVADWDEADAVTVHGFSPGPWQDALLAALPHLPLTLVKEA